jgi:hypothetical protein
VDQIFTLRGAVRDSPAVDLWLDTRAPPLKEIAKQWFAVMLACGNDVSELLHDGCPVACVDDAAFGYVNVFKAHVNVGFFHGADLEDPAGLLIGTGKHMRHVRVKPGAPLDSNALETLISAAYADIKSRVR